MAKILSFSSRTYSLIGHSPWRISARTFLSEAYQCSQEWDNRLSNSILQKINLDEFYHGLDQRFQKTRQMSAVDVDIFTNAVKDDTFLDEMLDLVHKLRLSADTGNALDSMPHAVCRVLIKDGKFEELLNILDDRLNYGVFLDNYTGNLLLDLFWKSKDYVSGCRIASQFMLQEDVSHPITSALSLLHCYNYLLKPEKWPVVPRPPEPEEEVKVRVKYIRNPYDDEHFDLEDPSKIVGKTIYSITKPNSNSIDRSFSILGLLLYGKEDKAVELISNCKTQDIALCKEIVELVPEEKEIRKKLLELKLIDENVQERLTKRAEDAVKTVADKDVENQLKIFKDWEVGRMKALEEQKQRLDKMRRLEEIDKLKSDLKDKETKLWFFENEEQVELKIEAKKIYYPKRWFGKKKKPRKIDEGYIPPELSKSYVSK